MKPTAVSDGGPFSLCTSSVHHFKVVLLCLWGQRPRTPQSDGIFLLLTSARGCTRIVSGRSDDDFDLVVKPQGDDVGDDPASLPDLRVDVGDVETLVRGVTTPPSRNSTSE
jgi:hypothetical protein